MNAKISDQLENFSISLGMTFYKGLEIKRPKSWKDAFQKLKQAITLTDQKKKKVILFFDEVPWLATRRSEFLNSLEYFWNTWASRRKNIKLIICGSAASWILQKIVNSKGGLHNRVTATIRLLPFNLSETKAYLKYRGIRLNNRQILDIYMVMGGIPHYLKQVKKGLSAVQNINAICFSKDGFLVNEFDKLYDSLFENSKAHKKIVIAFAKSRSGLPRNELLKALKSTPGGTLNRIIDNLEESGFIAASQPYGKRTQGTRYRLDDEYSHFYLQWIRNVSRGILNDTESNYWKAKSGSQSWKIWAGYAFETICMKHTVAIKKALGISGVLTHESSWSHAIRGESNSNKGVQIDLLLDRDDKVISICEIKCHNTEFSIDKKYSDILRNKIETFREQTTQRKSIFLVMVTIYGTKKNKYYHELVDNEVTLNDLI